MTRFNHATLKRKPNLNKKNNQKKPARLSQVKKQPQRHTYRFCTFVVRPPDTELNRI
jgi:hypothetical protein